MTWREIDDALLAELEEEGAIEALWLRMAPPSARGLPARSSSLGRALRRVPGGDAAIAAAIDGNIAPLSSLVLREELSSQPPELVHGLAVFFDRLARAYFSTGDREAFLTTYARAIACFLRLKEEKAYVIALARRIVGPSLSASDAELLALSTMTASLAELGECALLGARTLEPRAEMALHALARVEDAGRKAGLERTRVTGVARRAESMRARAIDEALSPVLAALEEAKARAEEGTRGHELFEKVMRVWEWSGREEHVERFAVDEVTSLAWNVYREAKWDALRSLLTPCLPLFDSLAERILRDPRRHVAYAAKCAQVFVFRSECETDRAREHAFAEHALRLCPTHRNARLVMAHLLCNAAVARLGVATMFPRASDIELAAREITRAEELFPQSRKLPEARARLDEVRRHMGGGALRP